ncbi:hypothetical protein SAMN02745121_06241 [Nannocystis exedens]|uniref:Uncharacterized protein n=1 Tax=Nannocystis exedens TaxID=54 RepID=A0A1I2ETE8_9BACT|nr:hypothetical protein NAEX_06928 [Nannocystis exedens]SFE95500.1 hypothetical protein SAMN02745121_06241 [Nannocystis exedens]
MARPCRFGAPGLWQLRTPQCGGVVSGRLDVATRLGATIDAGGGEVIGVPATRTIQGRTRCEREPTRVVAGHRHDTSRRQPDLS